MTEVRHKKLRDLTDRQAQMDGALNAEDMADALTRFYPGIGPESDITIVLYNPPKAAPARARRRAGPRF